MSLARRVDLLLSVALLGALAGGSQDAPPAGPEDAAAELPLAERRERARQVLREGGPEALDRAAEMLSDPDAEVRTSAVRYLAEVELDDSAGRELRLSSLTRAAADDPSGKVRRAALVALGSLRSAGAAAALRELVEVLPPPDRDLAAEKLAGLREGAQLVAAAVRAAFSESGPRAELPAEVLARLLPAYAIHLAETEGGGEVAADRAPLVLGRSHPDPLVRRSADRSLQAFLGRLRELDRHRRADRMLESLIDDGLSVRVVHFTRAVAALEEGGVDPGTALEGARELGRSATGRDVWTDLRWRSRAAVLEGAALIALDRFDEAEEALLRAGDLLDGLLALRVDRSGTRADGAEQSELLLERSLVELGRAFRRVAAGGAADDLALLEILRRAHRLQLEAQRTATAADAPAATGMDPFFDAPLSPFRLVFAVVPHPAWPPERCIAVSRKLGRSLASVSAREMPGFDPFPDLPVEIADPVRDPRRAELLAQITAEEIDALRRRFRKLRSRSALSAEGEAALEAEMAMVSLVLRQMQIDKRDRGLAERYFDLRMPSPLALQLAEALRREGDNAACRVLATRLLAALEGAELPQRYSWAVRLAARTRLTIGGAWTDENEAERAEQEMLLGLELLEGLKTHYLERDSEAAAEAVDEEIADALVSLAVNANVKMREPEKALGYFERAYELRQDDFMRILLACYRARMGRFEEARELIRGIPVSPRGYYNLACTYALLGEPERALELLERDLEENRRSAGALEKQREWAREDPDLEGLRGDPRFEWLTRGE